MRLLILNVCSLDYRDIFWHDLQKVIPQYDNEKHPSWTAMQLIKMIKRLMT